MLLYLKPFLLVFFITACGSNVPGYVDLNLSPADTVRKEVFDAAASYKLVQVVLEQVVTDPLISSGLKSTIQTVDAEVTAALGDYRSAVETMGPDIVTARLTVFINSLGRAQALLIEAQTEGLL